MHPYNGTPTCPRCSKAVYAAEQVMGPGRKLYHKPCLVCTACSKRLDSFTLLEHDQEPYCKQCHSRLFGSRDLRQANLPHREESFPPPDPSLYARAPGSSIAPSADGTTSSSPTPLPSTPPHSTNEAQSELSTDETLDADKSLLEIEEEDMDTVAKLITMPSESPIRMSHAANTFQRSPLTSTRTGASPYSDQFTHSPSRSIDSPLSRQFNSATLGRSNSNASPMDPALKPLVQTATGTRYGTLLGRSNTGNGSPTRQWGGVNPQCPKCGKSVYFAEQVKAIGKTWHKGCLRCTQCNTSLDSTRLTEKDGAPFCHRCYSKVHGPAGSGYALMGKAGG